MNKPRLAGVPDYSLRRLYPLVYGEITTGLGMPAGRFRKQNARADRLIAADYALADKLLDAGIESYKPTNVHLVGNCTEIAVRVPPLRAINIFESVQQTHRSAWFAALTAFAAVTPGARYFRYAVVTGGARIKPGADLAGQKSTMLRRISRWQREALATYGIELLLTVVELPYDPEKRSFHLHFNLLYWPHRRLDKATWADFLAWSWSRFGVHWQDNGVISDYAELLKYVLKSSDRDNLDQSTAKWLYDNLYRSRLIVSYNSLSSFVRQLRLDRTKPAAIGAGNAREIVLIQKPDLVPSEPREPSQGDRMDENMVIGTTAPMARATAWRERHTIIRNFTLEPKTAGGRRRLEEWREQCAIDAAWWQASGAPSPHVAAAVSAAWLACQTDDEAEKITPISSITPAAFRVHTTQLTRHGDNDTVTAGIDRPLDRGGGAADRRRSTGPPLDSALPDCNLRPYEEIDPMTGEVTRPQVAAWQARPARVRRPGEKATMRPESDQDWRDYLAMRDGPIAWGSSDTGPMTADDWLDHLAGDAE